MTTWEPRAWTSDVPVSYRKQSLRQAHLNIYIIYSWSFAVTNGGEETSSDGDRRGMTVHTFSPRDPPNEPRAPNSTFDDAFLQNPVNTHIQTMRIFFHFLENRIPRVNTTRKPARKWERMGSNPARASSCSLGSGSYHMAGYSPGCFWVPRRR